MPNNDHSCLMMLRIGPGLELGHEQRTIQVKSQKAGHSEIMFGGSKKRRSVKEFAAVTFHSLLPNTHTHTHLISSKFVTHFSHVG